MVCNSTSALGKLLSNTILSCKKAHYEIAAGTQTLFRLVPNVSWKLYHVNGHQDRHTMFSELDMWAKENFFCNIEADLYRESQYQNKSESMQLPIFGDPWQL